MQPTAEPSVAGLVLRRASTTLEALCAAFIAYLLIERRSGDPVSGLRQSYRSCVKEASNISSASPQQPSGATRNCGSEGEVGHLGTPYKRGENPAGYTALGRGARWKLRARARSSSRRSRARTGSERETWASRTDRGPQSHQPTRPADPQGPPGLGPHSTACTLSSSAWFFADGASYHRAALQLPLSVRSSQQHTMPQKPTSTVTSPLIELPLMVPELLISRIEIPVVLGI